MKEFVLGSSQMVYSPGFVAYLVEMAKADRSQGLRIAEAGWPNLTQEAYSNLLDGRFVVDTEKETVTVQG